MAQIPSHYYENFPGHEHRTPDNYHSSYTSPFPDAQYTCNSPTNTQASPYSTNGYQSTFSPAPLLNPYGGQSFCDQSANLALNIHGNVSFIGEKDSHCQGSNQRVDIMDDRYHTDGLEEHLDEIPVESLLHMSNQEGQLINDSEAKAAANEMSISQDNDFASLLSSDSEDFLLGTDKDEEDSRSTMHSVTSTSESVVSPHSLNHCYDQSSITSVSPILVSSNMKSRFEPPKFTDSVIPSQSYARQDTQSIINPSSSYSSMNCETLNNSFPTSNNQVPLELGQKMGVPQVSPQGNQNVVQNYTDPYLQNKVRDLKQCEASSTKKKSKQNKKAAKQEQGGPKNSKKPKVSDSSTHAAKGSINEGFVTASANSLSLRNSDAHASFNKELSNGEDSDPDCPSTEVDSTAPTVDQSAEPKRIIRRRMRCPRGMKLEIRPCEVCGDKAKNMHFGGLVCDSCKAFFRRSVQSNAWDQFKCEKEGNCSINKTNRRCCQYCRFCKCEKIGMKMDWVMTESGRMNLFKNRLARTRQMKEYKTKEALYGDLPINLAQDDADAIKKILNTLHMTFGSMPYPKECVGDSIDSLSNIFVYLCKRFGKFFLKMTEDTDLCETDKCLLLKSGISMSLYINGAHMYDPVNCCWPAETNHKAIKVPLVTQETLEKVANIPDAFSTIMKFYGIYEGDLKDHVVAALMYLISFFLPEDPNLISPAKVQKIQEEYMEYLKSYLVARDGQESINGIYRKLMDAISYVKDILKYHTMVDIKPTIDHTNLSVYAKDAIMQSMTNLLSQIELSVKGNFPPYASVLKQEEKEALGMVSPSNALARRENDALMHHHPDTIAMFGPTTRTDQLVVHPLLNMIGDSEISHLKHALQSNMSLDGEKSKAGAEDDSAGGSQDTVDIDAVCDILKKLSHTDDAKMINIFKENIPKELLEKFSRNLNDHQS